MRPKLTSGYSLLKLPENLGLIKPKAVPPPCLGSSLQVFMCQNIFSLNPISLSWMLENYGHIIPTSRGENRVIRGESGFFLFVQSVRGRDRKKMIPYVMFSSKKNHLFCWKWEGSMCFLLETTAKIFCLDFSKQMHFLVWIDLSHSVLSYLAAGIFSNGEGKYQRRCIPRGASGLVGDNFKGVCVPTPQQTGHKSLGIMPEEQG